MNYQTSSKQDLWKLVKKLQKQVEQKDAEIAELRAAIGALLIENTEKVEDLQKQLKAEKASCNILIQGTNAEVTECTKLLQQLKDSNTELNKELDEVKEEAALLRKYEEVAERKLEQARSQCREWRYKHSEYADQIVEARRLTWELYDFLIKEEAKGLEIELDDVRAIIEQLHE